MPKPPLSAAGGLAAIRYTLRKGREAGGVLRLYRRMRTRNACKTCAYGMGGQRGGMVNEQGHFPEICKKSVQAQAGDMQPAIPEQFFHDHSIEELERWSSMQLEYAGRLAFPVLSEDGVSHFRRVEWDDALEHLAGALRGTPPDQTFFYASGRSSNEAAFLMQVLARIYGTTNIHNCSSYCHQASGVALARMLGSGTATVVLEDLDQADLAIVAGANPASNHPRLIVKLVGLRRRGGRVIVINPLRELGLVRFRIPSQPRSMLFGSDVSDIYLQPNIGSDILVFKLLMLGLLERGAIDRVFLRDHADGWRAVEDDLRAADSDAMLRATGLDAAEIERTVVALTAANAGMALWAMGLTHHEHGVDNIAALGNLMAARGWVGRPGTGMMPIRGHSNVQGVGSVGFSAELKAAYAQRMEAHYGLAPGSGSKLDTYASMEAAEAGRIRAAVLLGGNLWASNPDLAWAGRALRRIGTTAHITTKLNQGQIHGRGRVNLILPVLARDEERQATTQESMFNFVRLSDGSETPPEGDLRSEVELIQSLAARLLPPGPFPFDEMTDHDAIRRAIARVVPGYAGIESIGDSKQEFQIAGRTFHEPRFNTDNGRLQLSVPASTGFEVADDELRLMTIRSEGQFNTVVYEEEDLYRGTRRRDVVLLNADDGRRLGLGEHDPVTVENETGSIDVVVAYAELPPGNAAMYYPEANVLVPRRIDRASGTPAFKSVAVRLRR